MLNGIVAYHGTTADFQEFDVRYSSELGLHFGTADQANERLRKKAVAGARIIPVRLLLRKPLPLGDAGTWDSCHVWERLEMAAEADFLSLQAVSAACNRMAQLDTEADAQALLREVIVAAGYDSVVYSNCGESPSADADALAGPGAPSYIVFDPDLQVRPFFAPASAW